MAGQFVLWRISAEDRDRVLHNFAGSAWGALQHVAGTPTGHGGAFPGWTPASRTMLTQVANGSSNLANRDGLPPHRYLQFAPGALTPVPHLPLGRMTSHACP